MEKIKIHSNTNINNIKNKDKIKIKEIYLIKIDKQNPYSFGF